jgi:ribosome assembly protein YihI (activator of Der GTPase)
MRKQKLSVTAARMKAVRDKRYAMTKDRKDRKAQNQREGQRSGSDIHHKSDGSIERVSINNNRGNFGDGTKNE